MLKRYEEKMIQFLGYMKLVHFWHDDLEVIRHVGGRKLGGR
jgi:hypothetical protein